MNPDLHTIATAAKIATTILFVLAAGVLSAAYAALQELRTIARAAKRAQRLAEPMAEVEP